MVFSILLQILFTKKELKDKKGISFIFHQSSTHFQIMILAFD